MTLAELIENLQDKADEYGRAGVQPDQIEVYVVSQPSYPLNNNIQVIATDEELAEAQGHRDTSLIVWIGVDQVGGYDDSGVSTYGSKSLWRL
jgi:hypothetical protein